MVPRPAAAPPRRAGRAPRALPASGRRAEPLRALVGIDVSERPERVDVVGEGIDLVALERVAKEVAGDAPRTRVTADALDELDSLLAVAAPGAAVAAPGAVGRPAGPGQGHGDARLHLAGRRERCAGGATSWSSAATSTTPPPRRPRSSPGSRDAGRRRRVRRRGPAPRGPPPEHDDDDVAGRRPRWADPARPPRRRLRLRQPQGGVRHRHPRGHGRGARRRRPERRRPRDLRRRRRHRRAHRHVAARRPSPRASAGPSTSRRRRGAALRDRRVRGPWCANASASTRWPPRCATVYARRRVGAGRRPGAMAAAP